MAAFACLPLGDRGADTGTAAGYDCNLLLVSLHVQIPALALP